MTELATFLETFLGSPVRADGTWLHTLMSVDGGYFNARVRNAPVAELFVTPRSLDGFELTLRGERIKPDASFDTALTVSTNDHELARLWLDTVARARDPRLGVRVSRRRVVRRRPRSRAPSPGDSVSPDLDLRARQ